MLLHDDAVLLDLREDRVVSMGGRKREGHVHGDRLYQAGDSAAIRTAPRLARYGGWRAFRRDVPELLQQLS